MRVPCPPRCCSCGPESPVLQQLTIGEAVAGPSEARHPDPGPNIWPREAVVKIGSTSQDPTHSASHGGG
jgi:hypothetical protein